MTTHEYDAYCDTLPDTVIIDERYHEEIPCMEQQIQDEAEMKEAYDNALKREALEELKSYLVFCGLKKQCEDELKGLKWSIDAINRRLADLTEGGAA